MKPKVIGNESQVKAWQDAIQDMRQTFGEVVPPDWITSDRIAEAIGMCGHQARNYANALVRAGKAERKKFRIVGTNGLRQVYHYKLKLK